MLQHNNSLQFNISHADHLALFGFVHDLAIGIDLERIKPEIEIEQLAQHFFSHEEKQAFNALPPDQKPLAFFTCWTRKESFIKAKGHGLAFPLDQFEVSLGPDMPAALLATHWNPEEVSKWSLYSLAPAPDFVGAISVEGHLEKITYWEWK